MAHEYKSRDRYDSPFKSERCKASVHGPPRSLRPYQCSRKPWKDGWCKQHHPKAEAERWAQSEARWQQKRERSPSFRLVRAHEEIARLKARIAELEGKQS